MTRAVAIDHVIGLIHQGADVGKLVAVVGFSPKEIGELSAVIREHREEFERRWHEYFP